MRAVALGMALLCLAAAGLRASGQDATAEMPIPQEAQDTAPDVTLVFSFAPRAPAELPWEIQLQPDRKGRFRELAAGAQEQPVQVSEALWKRLSAAGPAIRRGHCESKQKGIAQTGAKTFSLKTGPALTTCTFNFSDDDTLNDSASAFIALAEMMHEGAKLQHDRRFDRLSLDADIDTLVTEMDGGRALEPGNIAPALQAIVDDDRVIERVRRKAARLLQTAVPGAMSGAADKPR